MTLSEISLKPKWPMCADHITSDGENMGLHGWGIITNRELQGYQSEISFEVGHATTIIEFDLDGKPVRTDSPFIDLAMHPGCRIFRKYTPHKNERGELVFDEKNQRNIPGALCYQSDQHVAQFFFGLAGDEIRTEVIEKRKESSNFKELFISVKNYTFELASYDKRPYLQYDCPFLGFRELAFPIIFADRVIAVFFVGQLTLAGKENYISNMIKNVANRFPGCFVNINNHNLIKNIKDAQEKWLSGKIEYEPHNLARVLTNDQYEIIIKNAISGIRNLEERLADAFSHRQHEHIRESILYAPVMKEFVKSTRLSEPKKIEEVVDESPLIDLWKRFETSLEHLVNCFSLQYAMAFGPSRIVNVDHNLIKIQAKAGKWQDILLHRPLNEMAIDISGLPDDEGYIVCSKTKEANKEYIGLLKGCNPTELGDFQLVLMPNLQHPSSSIAILLGYPSRPGLPLSDLPEHSSLKYMHQTMKSFFSLAILAIAAIRAKGLEELAKKQLLFLGHEAGQLSGGLDWLTRCYENAREFEKRLRIQNPGDDIAIVRGLRKKIEDLCADIRGYTGQMYFVFDTAERLGRLGSDVVPLVVPSYFRPYGDVLAKWKDTYRQECDRKCLQMRVETPSVVYGNRSNDPWRPQMWGDRFLFEQVVYNLVNNAEKYCYRGTKIDMDCKLNHLDKNASHILTVIDYGLPFDASGEDLFAPFMRGKGSGEVPGLGLGLYIVRIIVEDIFKGKVTPICDDQPISKYNIPLIKPYIDRDFEGKDETLAQKLIEELSRLKQERLYDSVVAYEPENPNDPLSGQKIPKYVPEDVALLNEINKSTFRVTIRAEIPPLKESEERK